MFWGNIFIEGKITLMVHELNNELVAGAVFFFSPLRTGDFFT